MWSSARFLGLASSPPWRPLAGECRSVGQHCTQVYDAAGRMTARVDALGSHASQVVTDTLLTDAWGREITSTGSTVNPYKAFGQWGYYRDVASRLYVTARHLDVEKERWLSIDPLGFEGGDWNLYRYVHDRPTIFVDPSGHIYAVLPFLYTRAKQERESQSVLRAAKAPGPPADNLLHPAASSLKIDPALMLWPNMSEEE